MCDFFIVALNLQASILQYGHTHLIQPTHQRMNVLFLKQQMKYLGDIHS